MTLDILNSNTCCAPLSTVRNYVECSPHGVLLDMVSDLHGHDALLTHVPLLAHGLSSLGRHALCTLIDILIRVSLEKINIICRYFSG